MSPVIYTVDIETRPNEVYAWGLRDQNIALSQIIRPGGLMMFAAQRHGSRSIASWAEWDGWQDMVKAAHRIYDEADYIVTYNGASFDNKYLRSAWAELGLGPPSPWRDIDLYRTVKKFAWPSRKLAFVCQKLGVAYKTDPGGMKTWDDIIRGDEDAARRARDRMVRYCRNDVRITSALYSRLLPWIDGMNVPMFDAGDEVGAPACTRCGSSAVQSRGYAYTTTYRYRRFWCSECGGWMRHKSSEPLTCELRSV